MIKINLLGQARPKTAGRAVPLESTISVLMLIGALALALIILFVQYTRMGQELDKTHQQIRALQAEKARLQQVAMEVEQYQREMTVLQQHIDVIEGLQKNRTGGQELLSMVANTVARTDALWLTSLSRKGNSLNIEGSAASINAVANFITQLKRSGYFGKVEIKEAKENDSNPAVALFTFSMTAEISAPAAPAASAATTKS
jgi:type IV pilus assembly protein PilN